MANLVLNPLSGPPPPDVCLERAPIAKVIAQVVFPTILAIRKSDIVASFQEAIRENYPFLEEERFPHIALGSNNAPEIKEDMIWRFSDRSRSWRVSLTTGFVALETNTYHNRQDFLDRLEVILNAVEEVFNPQEALRVGLRFIDRMIGPVVEDTEHYMRSEVAGVWTGPLGKGAQHLLTETLLQSDEGFIQLRWGFLPANSTFDPNSLEPTAERSWIMDFDMFTMEQQPFISQELIATTRSFAERIYTVFRWMVTDDFLRLYGGKP
jgi:uncharacterized protein (TIGR04255 family)